MRKLALTTFFMIMSAMSSSVLAHEITNNNNGGAFSGPGTSQVPNTVRGVIEAGRFADGMEVTLTGIIKKSLGKEMYIFSDGTGDITVDIDDDEWFGLKATPETTVLIIGEVDSESTGTIIDVKRIISQ